MIKLKKSVISYKIRPKLKISKFNKNKDLNKTLINIININYTYFIKTNKNNILRSTLQLG